MRRETVKPARQTTIASRRRMDRQRTDRNKETAPRTGLAMGMMGDDVVGSQARAGSRLGSNARDG